MPATYSKIADVSPPKSSFFGFGRNGAAAGGKAGAASAGAGATSASKLVPLDVESLTKNPYGTAKACCEHLIPYMHTLHERYTALSEVLAPWRLGLMTQGFFGLLLCFFGGSYMTLIAAVEAYRINGWEKQMVLIEDLFAQFRRFGEASLQDDKEDLDNDGIPDVEQIDARALAQRKTMLFFRTIDPNHFGEIIGGLQSGLFAVVATLKFEFAKAITLGTVIQQMLKKPVDLFITPLIEVQLPADYKKWAPVGLGWVVKAAAIWVAFFVQRVVSAYYSAVRGGLLFSRNLLTYCEQMGFFRINAEESIVDEVLGYAVAALGVYWQVSSGFQLPFPLNLLLLPATLAEWALLWLVNSN